MNEEAQAPARAQGRQLIKIIAAVVIVFAVAGALLILLIQSLNHKSDATGAAIDNVREYGYATAEAANGMRLHVLKTKPSNVSLEVISGNVTLADKVGVNGGFFYGKALVSMAVVNGKPVNGTESDYGSGWENMKYARGTLVWDGEADSLSVQVVRRATELKVKDATRFWAQGGISMSLGDDAKWQAQSAAEQAPFPSDNRLRSGAVYDKDGYLYLVVSETSGTLAAFRDAIKEELGEHELVDGIFLDGDGSSQLLSKEMMLPGDNRPVVQMIRIMK
ncbi:hypothetical protein RB620_19450 [Paenibacillus sp. LHD-117]|uniref:phosphodiester glycosidase family protein n=1 Tax=Paenibacillus sp. LHD-117 TaxID=3071412 RepID=UPI0027E15F06|nr:phosphodiester glycosidase family protein [Paenibacillus sp. LHD-117]MDQ6421606.1 hypothetical protein [Paenibacillus sp. LHD-117]